MSKRQIFVNYFIVKKVAGIFAFSKLSAEFQLKCTKILETERKQRTTSFATPVKLAAASQVQRRKKLDDAKTRSDTRCTRTTEKKKEPHVFNMCGNMKF